MPAMKKSAVRGSRSGRPVMALLDLLGRRWTLRIIWELREDRALTRVLSEMGVLESTDPPTAAEEFIVRDPEERLFYRGRWYEGLYLNAGASADDLRQLREFEAEIAKWVAFRDGRGRRAFAIPSALASDDAEVMALDRMSMAQWMDAHRWTSPRLRWLVDYGCRDDYGARLPDTSAWAGVFYFASRVATPGKESEPLITWPEGNGRLVAHLHDGHGRVSHSSESDFAAPPVTL